MLILSRAIRFAINPAPTAVHPDFADRNGYGGVPAMHGLGRYFEINVQCRGEPDAHTGYLVNIKDIDAAARATIIPRIAEACQNTPSIDPAGLLPELFGSLAEALRTRTGARCWALSWCLTPYYCIQMTATETTIVLLRQRFDFAASHRLHVGTLSDAENRSMFGKCNNPGGHGHNYQFEPCLAIHVLPDGRPSFTLAELEHLAEQTLIERFDHKHLNLDTDEFCTERGGVNPTVENIARTFFDLLAKALRHADAAAELRSMTVWETDRTSATYPA